ncbi:hypothetical protein CEXT_204841 [Caerostris extrusa]|uniref:Uncharacterized protein n=1 Tax=Caerostris extrusa TaxID=172846 RepID=A0AAV4VK23_CAEEX|nr:hypothetical protein CEXT_204841 [Caerostris extrusa]
MPVKEEIQLLNNEAHQKLNQFDKTTFREKSNYTPATITTKHCLSVTTKSDIINPLERSPSTASLFHHSYKSSSAPVPTLSLSAH